MTIQEEIKATVTNIIFHSMYNPDENSESVTKAVLEFLHSKGVMIKTGVGEIVADSPCTIEVPIVEPLIEVAE